LSTAVFFDLDGTLTDPGTGIVRCIQHAMERLGIERPAEDELAGCIGPPLLGSLEALVGTARAATALQLYRQRYAEIGWRENVPYPAIAETLRDLAVAGNELYVATSKPRVFADRIVRHFDLERFFDRIFGAELDGTRSEKGELLRFALSEIRPARRAVMVGDREYDIAGARQNRMRSVGVTYGYGSRRELEAAGADSIVDSPGELLDVLGGTGADKS
jgi:phosphoglycolate phosphatase